MARLDVAPGTESFNEVGDSPTFPFPTTNPVGSGPVLADSDDATGFDLGWSTEGGTPFFLEGFCGLPPITTHATLVSLEWHMRMACNVSGDPARITALVVSVGLTVDTPDFFGAIEADPTFTDFDGIFRDYSGAFPSDDVAVMAPHILAGEAVLQLHPAGFVTGTDPLLIETFISEFWFEATLIPPPPPTVLTGIAPLRAYPRSDGLGASSAARVYPPPPSIQASNRRAGGYL